MALLALGASLLGAALGARESAANRRATIHANNQNLAAQKEALQNTVRWRVEDARAAGIHPAFALGAQPMNVSPSFMPAVRNSGVADMGQDISRAITSMRDRREREKELARVAVDEAQARKLGLERAMLENDLLRSQIARNSSPAAVPPPAPPTTSAQGGSVSSPRAVPRPADPYMSSSFDHGREAANVTDYGYARTARGGLTVVPSSDMAERMEDNMVSQLGWFARNQMMPAVRGLRPPSAKEFPLPPGYTHWVWNVGAQEFRPARREYSTGRGGRRMFTWRFR